MELSKIFTDRKILRNLIWFNCIVNYNQTSIRYTSYVTFTFVLSKSLIRAKFKMLHKKYVVDSFNYIFFLYNSPVISFYVNIFLYLSLIYIVDIYIHKRCNHGWWLVKYIHFTFNIHFAIKFKKMFGYIPIKLFSFTSK